MSNLPSRRLLLSLTAALLAAAAAGWSMIEPRPDRAWIVEQARLPRARFDGRLVHVTGIRDFEYAALDQFTPRYRDRTYDLDALTSAWFVLTPFSNSWRGPAHTFVSFGFADSQFVAISVEARREPGEEYDPIVGLFKRYELIYVIGEERDLIGKRAIFEDNPVYVYPVRVSRERIREVFVEMLVRANALAERPEFYNTLTNSCTSNVIDHVNHIVPDRVPTGIKTLLPGYADEVAHRLGLLDTDLPLDRARARFEVNARARRFANDPAFSLRIRESAEPGASIVARP